MNCVGCGSIAVTERPAVTARGYRRFRCRDCGRQFNERSGGVLNRTCLPSDIVAFVVFCRLRYRLTLRDLSEILLLRGIEVSHETIRDWRPDDIAAIEAATARRDRLDRTSRRHWRTGRSHPWCTRCKRCAGWHWWRRPRWSPNSMTSLVSPIRASSWRISAWCRPSTPVVTRAAKPRKRCPYSSRASLIEDVMMRCVRTDVARISGWCRGGCWDRTAIPV
jgi:transposase-like protein